MKSGMRSAILGLLVWAQPFYVGAQGTIIYHNPEDIRVFSDGATPYEHALDLDGNGVTDFTFEAVNYFQVRPTSGNETIATRLGGGDLTRYVNPLAEGTIITDITVPPSEWIGAEVYTIPEITSFTIYPALHSRADTGTIGPWTDGVNSYVGVRFDIEGSQHYGWINLFIPDTIPDNRRNGGVIRAWAYNSIPGQPILAGQVPEPSTWALFALGGLAMFWMKRRSGFG